MSVVLILPIMTWAHKPARWGTPADVLTPDALAAVYGLAIRVMGHIVHRTTLVLSQ